MAAERDGMDPGSRRLGQLHHVVRAGDRSWGGQRGVHCVAGGTAAARTAAAGRAALGWGLALGTRLALLACITWLAHLTEPVLSFADLSLSWRDLVMVAGGDVSVVQGDSEKFTCRWTA